MSPPDQYRLRLLRVTPILQPQFLSHREPLRHNRQTPFRTNIYRIPFAPVTLSVLLPLHFHLHPRIHPRPGSHILQHPQCIIHFASSVHVVPPATPSRTSPQFLTLNSLSSS